MFSRKKSIISTWHIIQCFFMCNSCTVKESGNTKHGICFCIKHQARLSKFLCTISWAPCCSQGNQNMKVKSKLLMAPKIVIASSGMPYDVESNPDNCTMRHATRSVSICFYEGLNLIYSVRHAYATLSDTSSVTSSPLTSPKAATAALKSMVQKSKGKLS